MDQSLEKRLAAIEARLDDLDGGVKEEGPKPAPPSKSTFIKRTENEFPKWVFAMVDGELKSALIEREEDMPENAYESPEEAKAGGSTAPEPTSEPEKEVPPTEVEIPEDWREAHHSTRIKLAKSLPGGDDVVSADDADALIELEIERRGNA